MIPIPSGVRVWLATGHTDMRKGFPSLEDDIDTHEMDELDEREGDEIEICGELDEAEREGDHFSYDPPRTLGPLEPVDTVVRKVERQLYGRPRDDDPTRSNIFLIGQPPPGWRL